MRLIVSLEAHDRYVRGDPARLRQILCNLLRNAIKFTPADRQITLECCNSDDDPPRIRIIVRDTGIGMGPQTMQRIFNAFEQGEAGITRRFGGLGLGLMLSKALTEAHGGKLTAHSDGPGRGSTFTVEFLICPAPIELTVSHAASRAQLHAI